MNRRFHMSLSVLALILMVTAAIAAAPAAHAAQPTSGTVDGDTPTATWIGGPFTAGVPNQLGCLTPADPTCDAFALAVDLPPGTTFAVAISSEIEGDDYDLYVYHPNGTEAGRSANASGNESVIITHTGPGSVTYAVRVLPFTVAQGSTYQGIAQASSGTTIEGNDLTSCLEAIPVGLGLAGLTDMGQTISLDVAVLLDGVSVGLADQIMTRAAISYAPLGIDLNVLSYQNVSFTGTEGASLIQQAKDFYNGRRPHGSDLVYVLSSKDLTDGGETGLAGLADCIGGVRFATRAFAVGEASGIEESAIGPFLLQVDAHPEVAAHELGHLMGAHHHYANCVEGLLQGEPNDLSPCTLMFNFVDFQSLNFSLLEGATVRGHAVRFAAP